MGRGGGKAKVFEACGSKHIVDDRYRLVDTVLKGRVAGTESMIDVGKRGFCAGKRLLESGLEGDSGGRVVEARLAVTSAVWGGDRGRSGREM